MLPDFGLRFLDAAQPINRAHRFNASRVGFWPMLPHLTGGTFCYDLVSGTPATLTNVPAGGGWINNPIMPAHMFKSNSAGYIDSGRDAPFNPGTGDFALAFTYAGTDAGTVVIAGKLNGNDYWVGFLSGVPNFSSNNAFAVSGGSANDGKPHRWLATRFNGNFTLYLDGKLVAGPGAYTASINPSGVNLLFDHFPIGPGYYPAGSTSDMSYWSRGISDSEAWEDYEEWLLGWPRSLNWLPVAALLVSAPAAPYIPFRRQRPFLYR